MASLNLAGKTAGYVKITAPDDSSNNPTVVLPTESGELALKSDIGSGGGGDVVAQPPVAFSLEMTSDLNIENNRETLVPFDNAVIDTDNGLTGNTYVVKKAGLYDLSYSAKIGKIDDLVWVFSYLKVNNNTIIVDNFNFDKDTKVTRVTLSNSKVVKLEVGDEIKLTLKGFTSSGSLLDCFSDNTFLSGHMISSITEGSGGGDYTPEKMVWEVKKVIGGIQERESNTVYTNTNDVPLYVQLYTRSIIGEANPNSCGLYIDGESHGNIGFGSNKDTAIDMLDSALYIVPAGSTYELRITNGSYRIDKWLEARMPVAVGTGGKTVSFRGELSADQTVTLDTWTKVNLNTATIDTDNSLVDGKFKPSVAGYYQVNGNVYQQCLPVSSRTAARIYKNGEVVSVGSDSGVDESVNFASRSSNVSDVIYLNGTTDYLELWGFVRSSGTNAIYGNSKYTYLSAVLVSGGSASGDSIWKEEGEDIVTYDGVEKLTRNNNTMWFNPDYNGTASTVEAENLPLSFRVSGTEAMTIASDGRVDITGSLYVNGTPKSLDVMVTDLEKDVKLKDKLIEKLEARLDKLEAKLKK